MVRRRLEEGCQCCEGEDGEAMVGEAEAEALTDTTTSRKPPTGVSAGAFSSLGEAILFLHLFRSSFLTQREVSRTSNKGQCYRYFRGSFKTFLSFPFRISVYS